MAFGKKNVIQIDPLRFSLGLLGESKAGKTSLIYEYCKKMGGEDCYLFAEIGSERGCDAISGVNYINTPEWHCDFDEYDNSVGFADLCEDIIENKESSYKNLRVLIWDSYDQAIEISEKESIRLYNKEAKVNGKPVAKSINEAWGGFNRGEKKAMELMFDLRDRLLRVGVQSIFIGHCKRKEVMDVVSGLSYSTLTSDQQQNYFNKLKKDLHFLALLYVDREIVQEGTGKDKVGRLKSETRKIKFRDDSYAIDSGSRFADIVPEVNCNVDEFAKAITDAIEAEAKKGGQDIEASKKEQDAAAKKRTEEIAIAEQRHKEQKQLDNMIEDLKSWIKENKATGADKVKALVAKSKELGVENPIQVSDINDATVLLEYAHSL